MVLVTHRTIVNMGRVHQYYGELIELYQVEHGWLTLS